MEAKAVAGMAAGAGSPSDPHLSSQEAAARYASTYLNAKAGMDGVDKARVAAVVYEMSKGSAFFVEEKRRDARVGLRIAELQRRAAVIADLAPFARTADRAGLGWAPLGVRCRRTTRSIK